MSEVSLDHPSSRPCSTRRGFSRHLIREGSEHVILIDVDEEAYDEQVVIIDVPKVKRRRYVNVIHIDDDDADENTGTSSRAESGHLGMHFEGPSNTSAKAQFVKDNVTPVRLSKCKRTYSSNASFGDVHGLDIGLENIPSDFCCCEIFEDSSGKIQEKWTKGFSSSAKLDTGHCESGFNSISPPVNDGVDNSRCAVGEDQFLDINKPSSDVESPLSEDVLPSCFSSDLNEATGASGTTDRVRGSDSDVKPCAVAQEPGQSESRPFLQTNDDDEMHETNVASFSVSKQWDNEIDNTQIMCKDALVSEQDSIFHEREKIKETDEYKMAMEEEWAARQEALRVQAQEAKQLRMLAKRRKAETMRLMDMERRQKERVEEIRNSQKKEEETLNLREEIRAEVQKELSLLEMACKKDMASLLHELGISVAGWPTPSPQQVLVSYKKALLAFHPDRASRLEIRQQVEAEEKFKLITRMRDSMSSS